MERTYTSLANLVAEKSIFEILSLLSLTGAENVGMNSSQPDPTRSHLRLVTPVNQRNILLEQRSSVSRTRQSALGQVYSGSTPTCELTGCESSNAPYLARRSMRFPSDLCISRWKLSRGIKMSELILNFDVTLPREEIRFGSDMSLHNLAITIHSCTGAMICLLIPTQCSFGAIGIYARMKM